MTQTPVDAMSVTEASALARSVLDEVEKAVVGKRAPLTLVLSAVLAKGHVLLEDFPGLGKTLAARSLAQVLGLDFARVQFTPDLLPADITGSFLYNQKEGSFEFRRGPIFTGLVLADEINRTPPKTQSALLEAMQERQVDGRGRDLPAARPLPRARHRQPDRVRGHLPAARGPARPVPACGSASATPPPTRSTTCVQRRLERQHEEVDLEPGHRRGRAAGDAGGGRDRDGGRVASARYCVELATATREHQDVLTGVVAARLARPGAAPPAASR